MTDSADADSRVTRRNLGILAGAVALMAFPLIAQASGNNFLVSIGSRMLIYALAASSLNLALGYGGMVSLGHAAFLGPAYTTAILTYHFYDESLLFGFIPGTNNALIATLAAMMVAALFAAATGARFAN